MITSFIPIVPILQPQLKFNRRHRWAPSMQADSSDDTTELTESSESSASSTSQACPACGRQDGIARGCDGNGRIAGGLGAVVKWWPIKAYRPCPDYIKAKKTYRRAGQSLEEIAFGRKASGDDLSISERLQGK